MVWREDHSVRGGPWHERQGGRNRKQQPSGGGQTGSPSQRASRRTFPTGSRCRWILRRPSSVSSLSQREEAPEVSLGQYECLYILSLRKKRLGHMKMNSSVEIPLEKENPSELFHFAPSLSLTSVSLCSLPSLYGGISYSRYLTCQGKPDYLKHWFWFFQWCLVECI